MVTVATPVPNRSTVLRTVAIAVAVSVGSWARPRPCAALPLPPSAGDRDPGAPELYGIELPAGRVLPDWVADASADRVNGSRAYGLGPRVQAIPTPTGLESAAAGLAALVLFAALHRRRHRPAVA